jgi:hypothetical protein
MIERTAALSGSDSYSPQRRTALVLSGTGTAGAYHAGVLRALHEAGVKLDVVAGRGVGVVGALFAAVDGAPRLWDDKGFWKGGTVRHFYPWRPTLRLAVTALAVSALLVALPLGAMALGLIVFPIDFFLKMVGTSNANGLTAWYLQQAAAAFAPEGLPTWLPRLVLIVLGVAALAAIGAGWLGRTDRRQRGALWWRIVPAPLSAASAIARCWSGVWDLVRGAAQLKQPAAAELGRRYTELLTENLGQPGFRELLIVAHDVDAGRDLVFVLVTEHRRRDLVRRATSRATEARQAEVLDLSGVAREHLFDAVAAALTIPLATDPHQIRFAPDAYWRGETHRLCDRPASLERVLEELTALAVEQVVLVSAAPESPGPHTLAQSRLEGRARLGEYLQSSEAATVRDVIEKPREHGPRIYAIRPPHNPVGPFDFAGGFDDRSDRRQPLAELMSRGYQDAYHQFIEPVVGASGERVGESRNRVLG